MSGERPEMSHWSIIEEALSVYVENLREDDDEHNNAIADRAEQIRIGEGQWWVEGRTE